MKLLTILGLILLVDVLPSMTARAETIEASSQNIATVTAKLPASLLREEMPLGFGDGGGVGDAEDWGIWPEP